MYYECAGFNYGKFLAGLLLAFITTCNSYADDIVIGVRAHRGEAYAIDRWQPTIDYLQKTLPQHQFSLRAIEQIHAMEALVGANQLDFVITQPVAYVDLERMYNVSRLLTLEKRNNVSQFGSVIITQANRTDIQELKDIKQKSIAAVAKKGFGGWLIGFSELHDHGMTAYGDFSEVAFLGGQAKVVHAIIDGKYDAGVIRTGILENMVKENLLDITQIKVLNPLHVHGFPFALSTRLFPEWAFAKTQRVNLQTAREVSLALLELPANGEVAQKGMYSQWITPLNYNSVRDLMKSMKIGSYSDYGEITATDFLAQHIIETLLLTLLFISTLFYLVKIKRSNLLLEEETQAKEIALAESKLHTLVHQNVLDTAAEAIISIDSSGMIHRFNRSAVNLFGYAEDEVLGKSVNLLMPRAEADKHDDYIQRYLNTGEKRVIGKITEVTAIHKSGSEIPVEIAVSDTGIDGDYRFTGVLHDLRETKNLQLTLEQANKELLRLSEMDPLTKIANRRVYEKRLQAEIKAARRNRSELSMMMIDIDFFKAYNDHYGHDSGDKALVAVADVIKDSLPRATDLAARYGGEEFVVLLPATNVAGAGLVAERILLGVRNLALPHHFSQAAEVLTVSAGIAMLDPEEQDSASFFKHADNALYEAKNSGRNRFRVYTG